MRKVLRIVLNVIIWVFFAFAVCITAIAISASNNSMGVPFIFGKAPVTILSDSMKDTFQSGDLILINELTGDEKSELKAGDIITFMSDLDGDGQQDINTHRIVDVEKQGGYTYYATRGDNKQTNTKNDDQLVRYDMVVGKYTDIKIGGLGTVLNFLQTSTGFLLCILLPLILFFLYELYRFVVLVAASRSKRALSAEQEEEIKKKAIEEYLKEQADDPDKPADGQEKPGQ